MFICRGQITCCYKQRAVTDLNHGAIYNYHWTLLSYLNHTHTHNYLLVCLHGQSMWTHAWVLMGPDFDKMLRSGLKSNYISILGKKREKILYLSSFCLFNTFLIPKCESKCETSQSVRIGYEIELI